MNGRRLDDLRGGRAAPCRFVMQAGASGSAWFLLPLDHPPPDAASMFHSAQYVVYGVGPAACDAAMP